VITEKKMCCGGLFADDIVLLAPTKSSLKNLLNIAHDWGIKNGMTFGINKCATLVVKPKNFIPSRHYENPTFRLLESILSLIINILNLALASDGFFAPDVNINSMLVLPKPPK